MARKSNFLLGSGERLVGTVSVPKQGGPKTPPYDFTTARARTKARLVATQTTIRSLPADACPNDETVAIVTLHPRYISKSDFPEELFSAVGVRAVGSRARTVRPEKWGINEHPEQAITEDIFVAGPRASFEKWTQQIDRWSSGTRGAEQLSHLEDITAFPSAQKVRAIPGAGDEVILEVVLHNSSDPRILKHFESYAKRHGGHPLLDRRRDVGGLTFIPVRISPTRAEELARFSFVRVVRGMPSLRPLDPGILRGSNVLRVVALPTVGPLDPSCRAVVFDGGLSSEAVTALAPWVRLIEPNGIGRPVPAYQAHGLGVTSALLFGALSDANTSPQPLCHVDHVRVLDDQSASLYDLQYVDVLDRILSFLDREGNKYRFANISIGPNMAIEDDEVTAWTASLDERMSAGKTVVTVAAGNDGRKDAASGLNRIQPPADGVNLLAVGASDRHGQEWARAAYSCVGPGRSPGLVKPDCLAFGGSAAEPFPVLGVGQTTRSVTGTSSARQKFGPG